MTAEPGTATDVDDAAAEDRFTARWKWRNGAVAGFVATVVMGVAILVTNEPTLRVAIAGLYGQEQSIVAGWIAHLFHGTLFGVVFAALLSDPGLYRIERWLWKTVLAGLVYALVLAVVGAGFIMPVWLNFAGVGVEASGTLPYVTTASVLWHVVYGLCLGTGFSLLDRADLPY